MLVSSLATTANCRTVSDARVDGQFCQLVGWESALLALAGWLAVVIVQPSSTSSLAVVFPCARRAG